MNPAEQVLEEPRQPAPTFGVTIMKNGGRGTVHAPRPFAAFEQFATKP